MCELGCGRAVGCEQYNRTVVVNKVTREIRKSLKMKDICDATTEQCAALFGSDECLVYCCERPTKSEGLQQSAGSDEQSFKYTLLSEYRAKHDAFDSQHYDYDHDNDNVKRCRTENELKEAEDGARPEPGRGRNDVLKEAPPLHLIPGYGSSSLLSVLECYCCAATALVLTVRNAPHTDCCFRPARPPFSTSRPHPLEVRRCSPPPEFEFFPFMEASCCATLNLVVA